jgi:nitroreductase
VEFAEILKRRRMVRHFKPDPVPRQKLERIAGAAQRAPSAGFSQGQRIVVVTEKALMKRIADIAGEPIYVSEGNHPWLSTCGAQIVPCVSERLYHERYQRPDKLEPGGSEEEWPVPYWWIDIGCTVMLVLLAAIDEGLAAGFAGPDPATHNPALIGAELGIPDDFVPVGVIPVGWPLEDPPSPSLRRERLIAREFARWERW